jgi:hypothetical protein
VTSSSNCINISECNSIRLTNILIVVNVLLSGCTSDMLSGTDWILQTFTEQPWRIDHGRPLLAAQRHLAGTVVVNHRWVLNSPRTAGADAKVANLSKNAASNQLWEIQPRQQPFMDARLITRNCSAWLACDISSLLCRYTMCMRMLLWSSCLFPIL